MQSKKAKAVLLSNINLEYDKKISLFDKKITFYDFYEKLESIINDDKIDTIIIDGNTVNLTDSQIDELFTLFDKIRDSKKIITISTLYDRNTYHLALLGNEIYCESTANSSLYLTGYKSKNFYLKSFFEMIGVRFINLHVGSYKGAGENYVRDNMSDEVRENIKNILDDKLNTFISKIKKYRNIDITEDLLNGNLVFNENKNLIDKKVSITKFLEEYDDLIEFNDYTAKKKKKSKNYIGLITLDGVVSDKELSFENIYKKVYYFVENDYYEDLKGLVIEINSPGGSAYEAYRIYSYIKESFEGIPIYVSMKDVCASGGYYIASVGQKIYANYNTITGSIGVVMAYPTFAGALSKLNINYDGITKGSATDIFDFTQNLSTKSQQLLQKSLDDVYKEFKSKVIRGRLITDNRLEPIAQGLVWTGKMAVENGLADKIGSTKDAIIDLAKYLKLDNYKIIHSPLKEDIRKNIENKTRLIKYNNLINTPLMLCLDYFRL